MHHVAFLQDLAVVMIVAGLVTVLFHRFKQPVVLGYILAGVIIGPHTPPYPLIQDEATIKTLSELGLVSSYHHFHGEAHGQETMPTYHFQWKLERPFHIDYCFIPKSWTPNLRRVEIGSYQEWKALSDHRPLMVEIS